MEFDDQAARDFLRGLFDAAVSAADPARVLAAHLPSRPKGRCIVIGAGKSAAAMAAALEAAWPDLPLEGLVVTRYGQSVPTRHIRVLEAAHPVPDAASENAARHIIAAVQGLTPDDLVLALISGGGSALLALPAPGLTLEDKRAVNRALLDSGAPIGVMNTVRKQLSAIKGGRLAAACAPAQLVTLAISDVPGDDPTIIASGPTVPDTGTRAEALALIARHGVAIPDSVRTFLESPEPARPRQPAADYRIIARPITSLRAAAAWSESRGVPALILGDALEGEARDVAQSLAAMALSCRAHSVPAHPPCLLLSGGETTVTLPQVSKGSGGRNTEFLLAAALSLHDAREIWALAADTDGIDGASDAAGALITPNTLARATSLGLDAAGLLAAHDSFRFFDALGDLLRTGPTLTNVNDFRAFLIV